MLSKPTNHPPQYPHLIWIDKKTKSIYEDYSISHQYMNNGSSCTIYEGKNKVNSNIYAIKVINKADILKLPPRKQCMNVSNLRNETTILKLIAGHKHMINLQGVYENESALFFVFEKCCGGDLHDYLIKNGRLKEEQVKIIMKQLVEGIRDLHMKFHVVHCDLKLENIMFVNDPKITTNGDDKNKNQETTVDEKQVPQKEQTDDEKRLKIKIIDYGLSKQLKPFEILSNTGGTIFYIAPEIILEGKHGHPADCWSLGVIMFALLYGRLPFFIPSTLSNPHNYEKLICQKIAHGFHAIDVSVHDHGYGPFFDREINVSHEAKDLISKLLRTDHHIRYTADLALRHDWFK